MTIGLHDWVYTDGLSGIVVGISSNCVGRVLQVHTGFGPDTFIPECRLIRLEPPRSKPTLVWSKP